jgi:hypothetical protein
MSCRKCGVRSLIVLFSLLALLDSRARSQTISGTIAGTVTDQSGALVPGARIALADEATGDTREATTSDTGDFVFAALRPSTYTIAIEKPGFQTFRQTGLTLKTSERLALGTLKLTLGQSSQSVTITGEATPINTEGADTAPELNQAQLNNIPVAGRDVMSLLRVLPGVGSLPMVPWGEISQNDPAGPASNGGQFGSFTPNVGGGTCSGTQ